MVLALLLLAKGSSGSLGNPMFSSLSLLFALRVFFSLSLNIVVVGYSGDCCWLDMWVVNLMATVKVGDVSRKKPLA